MNEHARLRRGTRLAVALATMLASLILSGCGAGSGSSREGGNLSLVAYSTPREAYDKLTSAFGKPEAGRGITFDSSYGGSGEQSRAVEWGLPADVVAFSLEPDMARLVKVGAVKPDWNEDEYKGMVTDSVVVLAVRKGNPKGIRGWDDLTSKGIEVITPNPFTSGGARWNVMAAYGAQLEEGRTKADAVAYLQKLFKNVPVQ